MKISRKHDEEQKRERNWDPRQRWQVLQATIAWADAQQKVPRNSRQTCLRLQAARIAASFDAFAPST